MSLTAHLRRNTRDKQAQLAANVRYNRKQRYDAIPRRQKNKANSRFQKVKMFNRFKGKDS